MLNTLGKNIANERHKQHMTQEQLAELSDITINYLSKIERGIATKVSADSLYKISKALNVSMEYLISGETNSQIHQYKGPNQRRLDKFLSKLNSETSETISKSFLEVLTIMDTKKEN